MPPVFSGNVMRLPANMTGVGGVSQNITIPSVEVRIGSRKFKTTSGVCFKDDGVLFTLKGNDDDDDCYEDGPLK